MSSRVPRPAVMPVPAITPASTRNSFERQLSHRARMEGKKLDRARRAENFKPRITKMSRNEIRRRFGPSISHANRHTGKPHEHAQEIARRQRQQELV